MNRKNLKAHRISLTTFVAVFTLAVVAVLYFERPAEMSSNAMDKQLLDSIKQTVLPSDIKSFIDIQKIPNSIVNLQLFTICNETKRCSVYAFMGFSEDGAGQPESTLFVEVEAEGNLNRTSRFNDKSNCESAWRFKKSSWAIKIAGGTAHGEALIQNGDFETINKVPFFNGRNFAINILHSMQRAIVEKISEQRSLTYLPDVECRSGTTRL